MRQRRLRRGYATGLLIAAAAVMLATSFCVFVPAATAASQIPETKITAEFPFGAPPPPAIGASEAILLDLDSGKVLYSRNANKRVPMASTTKIMTAVVVLESLSLDTKVTVSANAASTIGSTAGLVKGEILTVEQLLYAMLVHSSNDAAVALAETTSGTVKAFATKMNDKAKALGMLNTHFVNPDGLTAKNHFSSARDLATLARYAMQNPVFREIVRTPTYTLPPVGKGTPRKFKSTNLLLSKLAWVTGVKTGSTPAAGDCLVASGTRDGVSLLSVLLGAPTADLRFKESQALLEYGFSLYPMTVLADKGQLFARLPSPDGLGRSVDLVADQAFSVSLFKGLTITGSVKIDRAVVLPVKAGQQFGTVDFSLGGESLGSVNLVAAQPVPVATFKMVLRYWQSAWPPLPLGSYLDALPVQF